MAWGTDLEAFCELLQGLRNLVEGQSQRIDVLTLQGRDESLGETFADFLGDALFLATHDGELIQSSGVGRGEVPDENLDAFVGFTGALFEQVEEDVAAAYQSLQ